MDGSADRQGVHVLREKGLVGKSVADAPVLQDLQGRSGGETEDEAAEKASESESESWESSRRRCEGERREGGREAGVRMTDRHFLALCLQPSLEALSNSSSAGVMICCVFHTFGRRQNHGGLKGRSQSLGCLCFAEPGGCTRAFL